MIAVFTLALLHFVWQGTVVALLLWIALFLTRGRSAHFRYLMSCGALLVLLLAPAVTVLVSYPSASSVSGVELPSIPFVAPAAPRAAATANWISWLRVWAVPVWALGVLFFSVRLVWGSREVSRIRHSSQPADETLTATIARIASRMGLNRQVDVLISALAAGPSVVGALRPAILLPAATILGLSPEQLEAVLAHELAHIRRNDYLVNLGQMVAEALLFYHPAVWWVSARIRRERELCCDDEAVRICGDNFCYARALTALERIRVTAPNLALGSTDGPLAYRIKRLMGLATDEATSSKLPAAVTLCLILACLGIGMTRVRAQVRPDAPGVKVDVGGSALIHRTPVKYPPDAQIKNVAGAVSVQVRLDAAGNVSDAWVLSGPDELRKSVLQSVLGWHFTPGAAGTTRLVTVQFDTPPAEKNAGEPLIAVVRTEKAAQFADTTQFLQSELDQAKENLLRLQEVVDVNPDEVAAREAEIQARKAEIEAMRAKYAATLGTLSLQRLHADESNNASAEVRAKVEELRAELLRRRAIYEGQSTSSMIFTTAPSGAEPLHLPPAFAKEFEGRKLLSIRLAGLNMTPDEFAAQAQLPIHEGDTVTPALIEATVAAIKKFDQHLAERWIAIDSDGLELTIYLQ